MFLTLKQMLPLVLNELVSHAKRLQTRPPAPWRDCAPRLDELQKAEAEATAGAQFDVAGLKKEIWDGYKAGRVGLQCREAPTGRVLAFVPPGVEVPWLTWGRILQWFGPAPDGRPWLIIWYAAAKKREFPGFGQDLGPEHVNGGYTQPCSTHGIFIYREEEATRVLIHELLHATCLDEPGWSIPLREAMIESWAELILTAITSKGHRARAAELWSRQAQWIADTNWRARHLNGTNDISDYAWRYLLGRVEMLEKLGIVLPAPRKHVGERSLRFTHPDLKG